MLCVKKIIFQIIHVASKYMALLPNTLYIVYPLIIFLGQNRELHFLYWLVSHSNICNTISDININCIPSRNKVQSKAIDT